MLLTYIDLLLKLCSLGLVIAAGGLWAGAGVDTRPKYNDEQTLVGGAIWSQTLIPVGLMISKMVDRHIDSFVYGYFLVSGIIVLCVTGIVLVLEECKSMNRYHRQFRQASDNVTPASSPPLSVEAYDKIYFAIGILCIMAAIFKSCELMVLFP